MRGSVGRRTRAGALVLAAVLLGAACGGSGAGTGAGQAAGGGATTVTTAASAASGGVAGPAGAAGSASGALGTGGGGAATPGGSAANGGAGSATTAPTGLDQFDFLGFTYDLGPDIGALKLTRGEYQRGSYGDVNFVEAQVERVVTGDLTGDGEADAAVTLHFSTGGTGQFTDVFVYRSDGRQPVLVGRDGVGDRADGGVRYTAISNGQLLIDRYAGTAACCPESVQRQLVAVTGGKLVDQGPPRSLALAILDIDGADIAKTRAVKFLPGTDTGILEAAIPTPPAAFDARQGQKLTLQVQETNRGFRFAPLELVQNGAVVGTARPGVPLALALPTTGSYVIRPAVDASTSADSLVSAELTITG